MKRDEFATFEFEQKKNLRRKHTKEILHISKFITKAGKAQIIRYCHD
jgi:hypothetical protein